MSIGIAWFASAKGQSSRLLFNAACEAIRDGQLDAEIVCVVCNRERGQSHNTDAFLDDVEAAGVPTISRSSGAWRQAVGGAISDPAGELAPWRRDYDAWIREQLDAYQPEIAMLAGYMLVVSDVLCDSLPMLNLHPALPGGPIGTWQAVIHQLIRDRATRSGMLLQRVTTELDRGPTVTWCQYPIVGPDFDALWAEHGNTLDQETPLFRAIRSAGVARESLFILDSLQAIAAGAPIPASAASGEGVEITERVERRLRQLALDTPR